MTGPVLIPAAGKSRRMGTPKLLLPLAGQTVLRRLLDAIAESGVGPATVVVGPGDAALAREAAGAALVTLPIDTPDMRATVLAGLAALDRDGAPMGFFLVPADHPVLAPEAFRAVAAEARPERIVVPTWNGRRGHPTWIGWAHVAGIREQPPGEGINAYLRRQTSATLELPYPNDAVTLDLDTPDDYAALVRRFDGGMR